MKTLATIIQLFVLFIITNVDGKTINISIKGKYKYTRIVDGLSAAKAGDTIVIHPGVYLISPKSDKSFLKIGSGITLKGTDRFDCIIKVKRAPTNAESLIMTENSNNITIENLTLDCPTGNLYLNNVENFTLKNCILKGWRQCSKEAYALKVADGGMFSGESKNILIEHNLFENSNIVYLGDNTQGVFRDNCLSNIKNINLWHLVIDGWKYEDIYVHETTLVAPKKDIYDVHNLASRENNWIYISDGLSWGVISQNWVRKKKKVVQEVADTSDFFDIGVGDDPVEVEVLEIEDISVRKGPEIYITSESKIQRKLNPLGSIHIIKGVVLDEDGLSKVEINGEKIKVSSNGKFEFPIKLDLNEIDVSIHAVDSLGDKSNYDYAIRVVDDMNYDSQSPEIFIGKLATRSLSFKPIKRKDPVYLISGYVSDESGVESVYINGKLAELDHLGNFNICSAFKAGEHSIKISAIDKNGNEGSKTFNINIVSPNISTTDKSGPEICIVDDSNAGSKIDGVVKDQSDVQLLCINGERVRVNKQGVFSHKLDLTPGPNLIRIAAYDKFGNKTDKLIKRVGESLINEIKAGGQYHALVIGNNHYEELQKLKSPIRDARSIASLLESDFGFKVRLLEDATRSDIVHAMGDYRKKLKPEDKLLIYYAGHGYYDKKSDAAYWLPIDAEKNDSTNWILSASVSKALKANDAKSILIVSDSCYSGTLSGRQYRDAKINLDRKDNRKMFLKKMSRKASRLLMGSGGNEPVLDSGGAGGHSIFARAFMDSLNSIKENVFTVNDVFSPVRTYVGGGSDQVPVLDIIYNSGHDSGTFVFCRDKQ